jgi:hypothetical protein
MATDTHEEELGSKDIRRMWRSGLHTQNADHGKPSAKGRHRGGHNEALC